jgi:hypothetical protein
MKQFFSTYDGERQSLTARINSTQQAILGLLDRLAEHKRQSLQRPADQIIRGFICGIIKIIRLTECA